MSILDTFLILFESNADDVKKGAKEAQDATRKLDDDLKHANDTSGKLGKSFLAAAKTFAIAATAAFSVGRIAGAVFAQAQLSDALGKTADALGVNVEDLDAWGQAAARSGGSAAGFESSLGALNRGMAEFSTKGTSRVAPFFDQLGISMTDASGKIRPVMDLLPELADAFEGLSKQESTGLGEKLGLDAGTIMLLQSGRRAVEDLVDRQKSLGVITKEQAEIAAKFNDQWDDTGQIFRGLYVAIGTMILPALTSFLQGFEAVAVFMRENGTFIEGFFIAIGSVLTVVYTPSVIAAAAATWALIAPYLAVAAVVLAVAAAFAIVYDDAMNFLAGNQSVIGELSARWPIIGDIVRSAAAAFEFFWDVAGAIFDLLFSRTSNAGEAFGKFGERIAAAFEKALPFFPVLQAGIEGVGIAFDAVGNGIVATWNGVLAVIEKVASIFGAVKGALGATFMGGVELGQVALATAGASGIASQTSTSISSRRGGDRNTTVTVGEVNVQTQATDAEGVSAAIGQSLGNEMRQAVDHFDDGTAG
jgi:hypothetical protein